ncbi:Ubiquitin-protein ligase [Scheffersomyces spartinae]|uniref:Ubiquitin-protein ligase n=1 Tax=Scheffersomyces spartinae TaxID=45513 RepID=A0A9P7V678_9ASCO|nr:Ubiquitin-protein ligase [Scheffersomyces spartinae]KAG7192127.1 Ubiquitin-protein ligase [Scheffersomyces spartinae]
MDNTDNSNNTSANQTANSGGDTPSSINQQNITPSGEQQPTRNGNNDTGNGALRGYSRAREMYHDWISSNREAVGPSSIVVNEDHSGDSYNILSRILGGLNDNLNNSNTNNNNNNNEAQSVPDSADDSNLTSPALTLLGTEQASRPGNATERDSASGTTTGSSVPDSATDSAPASGNTGDSNSDPSSSFSPSTGAAVEGSSTSSSSTSNPTDATAMDNENDGQIIITVNYAFSDENNPANPNRTGSLVMTIPNVASNRTPGVIDELILLATQLAYSSIVDGMKVHKGITVEKFNSFAVRDSGTLLDKNCSICFEEFQGLSLNDNIKKRSREDLLDTVKRRKQDSPAPTETPSNDVTSSSTSASTSTSTSTSASTSSSSSSRGNNNNQQPQYLAEVTTNFLHVPIEIPCGHVFGKSCLCEWFKEHSSCPLCRSSVTATDKMDPSNNNELDTTGNNTQENPDNQTGANIQDESNSTTTATNDSSTNTTVAPANDRPRMQTFTIFSTSTPTSIFPRFPRRPNQFGAAPNPREVVIPNSTSTTTTPRERGNDTESFISSLLSLFRRPQTASPEPLFPTTIGSRRTANGIETTHDEGVHELTNLRSLINGETSQTNDTPNDGDDNNETNNQENADHNEANNNDETTDTA